jgi:putative redox protein
MQVTLNATFLNPEQGMRVDVATDDGQSLAFDAGGPGDDSAASPMRTILAALAACTSMDVASILRKKRQVPTRYTLHLVGERAEQHPRVYTRIVVEHRVEGEVAPEALRRSIELSAIRYCPVSAMLSASAEIEHRYRIGAEGEEQLSAVVLVTGPGHAAQTA